MIRGYPEPPSVPAGGTLRLRVSSGAAQFHAVVYRLGASLAPVAHFGPWPGRNLPAGRPDVAWDWPAYPLAVGANWVSGIYLTLLVPCVAGEDDGRGGSGHGGCIPREVPAVDGRDGRAIFVVRPASGQPPAPLLYKVALSTWHAYNASGGGSLYVGSGVDPATGKRAVTTSRPGGGTGGDLSFPSGVDVYDPASPREGAAHWDAPFVSWLEQAGYRADYCTDLDLHADPQLLDGHAAVLSVGHDEYWSAPTREAIEQFLSTGGNAAFFSGNTCFWRIEVDEDGQVLRCAHPPLVTAACDQWWQLDPETALTGVSYRHAGGWWEDERDPLGYSVVDAGHWVFAGTGLRDGDVLGEKSRLVGYECDGAPLHPAHPRASGLGGTPSDFHVLGVGRLGPGWQDRPDGPAAAATMGVHSPGGMVFSAATTDWARVLAEGDPTVDLITRNVLDAVSVRSRRVHAPQYAQTTDEVSCWVGVDGDENREEVHWASSAGTLDAVGPVARLALPATAGPVTVWARTTSGGSPTGFGAATIDVLDPAEGAQVELLEAVRSLAAATPPDPVPTLSDQPGNRRLTDARWEPRRDGLRRRLSAKEADQIARLGAEVVAVARRLRALLEDG